MSKLDDSITISAGASEVQRLLSDLERHPSYVPDGFKQYRVLSRETAGRGARAAVTLNLLGHWLPAELEVLEASTGRVVLKAALEPVNIDLRFDVMDRGGRTEVRLAVDFQRRMLPPWRIRTRIKQHLRLEQDVRGLTGRFLTRLKDAAEKGASTRSAATVSVGSPATTTVGGATSRVTERAAAPGPASATDTPATLPTGEAYVSAGLEAELGPGQARVVKVNDRDVAVFNIGGEFHAIDNRCPHRGGPLGFGVLDGPIVTCPLHGFRFDVTTGQCPDMGSLKVARYPLRRQNGELQIRSTPGPA